MASSRGLQRLVAVLIGTSASLLLVTLVLGVRLSRVRPGHIDRQALLEDPEVRALVIAELVSGSRGVFDLHPDPDVGRVLQPGLRDVEHRNVPVSTNRFGMRERDYAMPKPEGVVRVVLLGDSFVYGASIEAEDRFGVFLEEFLEEKRGSELAVECLHLGVGSWNAVSETEFVRRQLGDLQPDLVYHLIVSNDLDDTHGTRGFGSMAEVSPRYRQRAGARVHMTHPGRYLGKGVTNFLLRPAGWESRHRYEELARYAGRLADAVEAAGGRYVLIATWANKKNVLPPFLDAYLDQDQILYLPNHLKTNRELWVSPSDPHWNREGSELIGRLLFGVIRMRDLLPELDLEAWPEVAAWTEEQVAIGIGEAGRTFDRAQMERSIPVRDRLDFSSVTPEVLQHVNAGIDDAGRVAPYASLVLRGGPGGTLRVRGRCLDRPEIDGARVEILVEDLPLGGFEVRAGAALDLTLPLPEGASEWEIVCVRFQADDWIHAGENLRECVSFQLEEIWIEP